MLRISAAILGVAEHNRHAQNPLDRAGLALACQAVEFLALRGRGCNLRFAADAVCKQKKSGDQVHVLGNARAGENVAKGLARGAGTGNGDAGRRFSWDALLSRGDSLRQNLALRRQKLAPCPDSYWFRMDDYLTLAKAMREEARHATGRARAELIETAAQWEAIVCEHLDFLAELERVLR